MVNLSSVPICDSNTTSTFITRVDEDAVGQTSALSNIDIQANCPVYRLPTEILEDILIQCVFDHHTVAEGHPISFIPPWVRVSYVNRHWRHVALNCPTLWSYFFIASPRWTDELLSRSKQAPLKIHVNLRDRKKKDRTLCFLKKVTEHLERIQELSLHLSLYDLQVVPPMLSSRAPCLRNLKISVQFLFPVSHQKFALFNGDTPALQTLELVNFPAPWYSLKLSGLTILSLSRTTVQLYQETAEFLSTLSCMQDLTHLYLEDTLASASGFLYSVAFHNVAKINLSRLSHLFVSAPLSTVIALLSCVNIPSEAEVRLRCGAEHNFSSFDDYAPLCSLLAQRLGGISENHEPAGQSIRSLIVGIVKRGEVKLVFHSSERASFNPEIDLEWGGNIPLQITLAFSRSTTTRNRERIISHLCCPTDLPNAQSLQLFHFPFSRASWAHVFGFLQNLRYLKLGRGYMPLSDLASILFVAPHKSTEKQEGHADQSRNPMFVPALEEVELYDITFSGDWATSTLEHADVQSLCDALSTRTESRGRLIITRCTVTRGQKKKFNMTGRWEGGRFHVVDKDNPVTL